MRKPKPYQHKPKKKVTPRQRNGDYRIFVGAFPKGEKIDQIQQVREQIDWQTSQITPPHVTLAGTYWRTGQPNASSEGLLIDKLTSLAPYLKPLTLPLGGIYTFGERVIYLGVLPTDEMLAIRNSLLSVMGKDKHRQFRPHLTLAMRLKGAAFSEALAELEQSTWANGRFPTPIHELRLMQRGPSDPAWRTIHTIPLTPKVSLRPVVEADVAHFFTHQQQPAGRYMAAFAAPDPDDREAYMAHWENVFLDHSINIQTILVDHEIVGYILCHHSFGVPEVGYWLDEAHWGKGIATTALRQFLQQLPTRPLYARTAQDNAASLRVLQKCGFVITGEDTGFAHGRGADIPEYLLTLSDD